MVYELESEQYKGPIEKLLELVEEKKLEITLINLAEVTGDFLNYLKKIEKETHYHSLIADFLVVASKLILIKSKVLIPSLELSEEEELDLKSFESRVRLYQELKKTQQYIKEKWSEYPQMRSRDFLMTTGKLFYPPRDVVPETMKMCIKNMCGELEKLLKPVALIKAEIISLKEKIHEVLSKLGKSPIEFTHIKEGKSKGEVVVLFLAILHLIKDQLVHVEQGGHFNEIIVAKKDKTA